MLSTRWARARVITAGDGLAIYKLSINLASPDEVMRHAVCCDVLTCWNGASNEDIFVCLCPHVELRQTEVIRHLLQHITANQYISQHMNM